MIRDLEIQRLINYAKGLGLTVTFKPKMDIAAAWYLDNTGILINRDANTTKIETVLSLIHELGHCKHNIWEKDRKSDPKWEGAVDHIDKAEEDETDTQKKQRKIVLDNEIAGTRYWHEVYTETNMSFPIWRLEAAMQYDIWHYEVFYETGSYPNHKERVRKFKEIQKKHRDK